MRNLLLIIGITTVLLTCTRRDDKDVSPYPLKILMGVCINDQVPLLEKPGKANKVITSLYLGDKVYFLGDSAVVDYSTFYYIEIAEGTQAWIDKRYIVMNANPAAILSETSVHANPDNNSVTIDILHPAEFIVTTKYSNDWFKIIGVNKKVHGWVNSNNVSIHTNDVYIATLAYSDLLDENGLIRSNDLPYFVNSIPNKETSLAITLNNILEDQVTKNIEKSIEEYETNYYTELITPED